MKAKSMWKTSWPFAQAGLRLGASQSAADSEASSEWNWRRVSSSSSRMRFPTSLSLTSSPPTSRLMVLAISILNYDNPGRPFRHPGHTVARAAFARVFESTRILSRHVAGKRLKARRKRDRDQTRARIPKQRTRQGVGISRFCPVIPLDPSTPRAIEHS